MLENGKPSIFGVGFRLLDKVERRLGSLITGVIGWGICGLICAVPGLLLAKRLGLLHSAPLEWYGGSAEDLRRLSEFQARQRHMLLVFNMAYIATASCLYRFTAKRFVDRIRERFSGIREARAPLEVSPYIRLTWLRATVLSVIVIGWAFINLAWLWRLRTTIPFLFVEILSIAVLFVLIWTFERLCKSQDSRPTVHPAMGPTQ